MEIIFKVGPIYNPQTLELTQFFDLRYIAYPRLHRLIIFPSECPMMDYCLLLVTNVTLG